MFKATDLRSKSNSELQEEVSKLREELAKVSEDLLTGKSKKTSQIISKRRGLARILTVIREKEILEEIKEN